MSDLPISASPVEQAGSAVGGARGRELTGGKKLAIVALVAGIALGAIWLHAGFKHVAQRDQDATLDATGYGQGDNLRPPPAGKAPPPSTPLPPPQATLMNTVAPQDDAAAKALASGIMAFSSNAAPPPAPAGAGGPIEAVHAVGMDGGAGGELATRLKATVMQGAKASLLPHPDFLITEGTIIPCTLQTAIDSTLVGFVKCVLPQAVRSTTGSVVLLDRGTTIVGQVQSGLMQGQNRLFILWTRAETPDHVIIALDSPAADSLGRAGVDGAVNNHFWQRFGGAIMLSFIDTGLQAGASVAGSALSSNGGVTFNSFQSNGQNAAAVALNSTINIPPTLTKNQGENVSVFVARDLDFSDVYRLQVSR